MIFTRHGEPVEVVGVMLDVLDPSTLDSPILKVRSLNDKTWEASRRAWELRADGGAVELQEAIDAYKQQEKADAMRMIEGKPKAGKDT